MTGLKTKVQLSLLNGIECIFHFYRGFALVSKRSTVLAQMFLALF